MQKLRAADSSHLFWMDLSMLIIVFINLLYLLFGFLFRFSYFSSFIGHISIDFKDWYASAVFPHVFEYDLVFVLIYVAELIFRWIRSIVRHKYDYWWFYPFVHWYDVIMCIPLISGYNFFAALRLFGLFYRFQRLGVFDITKTYVFKQTSIVSEVMVEEISDRVIAKMISMAQEEVQQGSPVLEKIVTNVIQPREEVIVNYLSARISEAVRVSYAENREELKRYIEKTIGEAVKENETVDKLRFLPGLGKVFQDMLDQAVADITFRTVDKLVKDLSDPENTHGVKEVTHGMIASFIERDKSGNEELNTMVIQILHDSLEELKAKVLVKEWKIKDLEDKKHQLEAHIAKNSSKKPEA